MRPAPVTIYTFAEDKQAFSYTVDPATQLSSFEVAKENYLPANKLGEGRHSRVIRYQHAKTRKSIAVKMPLEPLTDIEGKENEEKSLREELSCFKKAHPNAGFYHMIFIPLRAEPEKYTYFLFTPAFEGVDLNVAIENVCSRYELILYYLAVALELERIHQELKLVHNDAHGGNFIIDGKRRARAIDFGRSHGIGEPMRYVDQPSVSDCVYLPPETWSELGEDYTSSPAQDMYHFGATVRLHYAYDTKWVTGIFGGQRECQTTFYPPEFLQLCYMGLRYYPPNRPTFADIIGSLKGALIERPQASISINCSSLDFGTPSLLFESSFYVSSTFIKSDSGATNIIFNTHQGKVRLKFFRQKSEARHADAIIHQRRIYPNEAAKYQHIPLKDYPSMFGNNQQAFFQTYPFFTGTPFDKYSLKNKSQLQLARVFLAIFTELQRIHGLGYLHGKLHCRHIIIDDSKPDSVQVHIVNFNSTYSISYPYAVTFDCKEGQYVNLAPERREISDLEPEYNQDISNVGLILKAHPEMQDVIEEEYLSVLAIVLDFCKEAVKEDPRYRPQNFSELISALKVALKSEMLATPPLEEKYYDQPLAKSFPGSLSVAPHSQTLFRPIKIISSTPASSLEVKADVKEKEEKHVSLNEAPQKNALSTPKLFKPKAVSPAEQEYRAYLAFLKNNAKKPKQKLWTKTMR